MKKKILFVIRDLRIGGTEKSLINLLNLIDYSKYDVSLKMFSIKGELLNDLPKEVKILKPIYKSNLLNKIILKIDSKTTRLINIFTKDDIKAEIKLWNVKRRFITKDTDKYDTAISYMHHSNCLLYLVDKIVARNKYCFVHFDFSNFKGQVDLYEDYFKRVDKVFNVGIGAKEGFIKVLPNLVDNVDVIHNVIPQEEIINKANEYNPFKNKEEIILVTVARLEYIKGIDLAIDACKLLINDGLNIKWYIIGDGYLREEYEQRIKEQKLEKNFILVGGKDNPYPYMKNCDIYVQPSRSEGRPIVIEEAKILCKPIVSTQYKESKYQLRDNENALISEISSESLKDKIKKIITNKEIMNKLKLELTKELQEGTINNFNQESIKKLYEYCNK